MYDDFGTDADASRQASLSSLPAAAPVRSGGTSAPIEAGPSSVEELKLAPAADEAVEDITAEVAVQGIAEALNVQADACLPGVVLSAVRRLRDACAAARQQVHEEQKKQLGYQVQARCRVWPHSHAQLASRSTHLRVSSVCDYAGICEGAQTLRLARSSPTLSSISAVCRWPIWQRRCWSVTSSWQRQRGRHSRTFSGCARRTATPPSRAPLLNCAMKTVSCRPNTSSCCSRWRCCSSRR